jgi:hypothetical protein
MFPGGFCAVRTYDRKRYHLLAYAPAAQQLIASTIAKSSSRQNAKFSDCLGTMLFALQLFIFQLHACTFQDRRATLHESTPDLAPETGSGTGWAPDREADDHASVMSTAKSKKSRLQTSVAGVP